MHGRSRMNIGPRISTNTGTEHAGFYRPGRHLLAPSANGGRGGRGGRAHLLLALSHWTIDHASLSRRSTVPTRNRDASNCRGRGKERTVQRSLEMRQGLSQRVKPSDLVWGWQHEALGTRSA